MIEVLAVPLGLLVVLAWDIGRRYIGFLRARDALGPAAVQALAARTAALEREVATLKAASAIRR